MQLVREGKAVKVQINEKCLEVLDIEEARLIENRASTGLIA